MWSQYNWLSTSPCYVEEHSDYAINTMKSRAFRICFQVLVNVLLDYSANIFYIVCSNFKAFNV